MTAQILDTHYVPILKSRAAELDAIRQLSADTLFHVTPMIEVVPVPYDHDQAAPTKTLVEHLAAEAGKLENAWEAGRALFVDLSLLESGDRLGEVWSTFLKRAESLRVMPVLRVDTSPATVKALAVHELASGVGLRFSSGAVAARDVKTRVDALLKTLNLEPRDVHAFVDLGPLDASDENDGLNVVGAVGLLGMLPYAQDWASLVLSGSSFPENLVDVRPGTMERVRRTEWALWTELRERSLQRMPTFSDYAIAHPGQPEPIDPRLLRVSAQLRYTCETEWLIFKERNIRDYGSGQFIDICERLASMDEFSGAGFSSGDAYIAARANGTDQRPGNPRTWRWIGTNHHITLVVNQLASLEA